MKRIGHLVAMLGAAIAISACSTAPTEVNHYQMYLPEFPALLVAHTPVQAPPDPNAYINGTWQQKEAMLVDAYNKQTANVWTCNIDKDNMADWWQKQTAVVNQYNANGGASAPLAASTPKVEQ